MQAYFVVNRGDRVIELAGQGTDTVWSTISYTLPGHVQNLLLRSSANLNGTANGLGNVLIGNRAANVLDRIFLDTSVFAELVAGPLAAAQFRTSDTAADGDDYLVYDSASGILSYDSSGSGAVALAAVAARGAGTALVAADIIAAPDILPGLLFNGGQFTYRPDTAWSTGLVFQASSDGGFTQTIDLV